MSAQQSYTDYLDTVIQPDPVERFVIDNASAADWALRKLAAAETERAEDQAFIAAERQRLETWYERREAQRERFAAYLTSLLQGYYEQCEAAGKLGGTKTLVLPCGRLSMRTQLPQWSRDEPVLLAWAESAGFVRRTIETNWAAVKSRLVPESDQPLCGAIDQTTGECVPGLRCAQQAMEVFVVKPIMDGKVHDE